MSAHNAADRSADAPKPGPAPHRWRGALRRGLAAPVLWSGEGLAIVALAVIRLGVRIGGVRIGGRR